jgi:hypothetical protein
MDRQDRESWSGDVGGSRLQPLSQREKQRRSNRAMSRLRGWKRVLPFDPIAKAGLMLLLSCSGLFQWEAACICRRQSRVGRRVKRSRRLLNRLPRWSEPNEAKPRFSGSPCHGWVRFHPEPCRETTNNCVGYGWMHALVNACTRKCPPARCSRRLLPGPGHRVSSQMPGPGVAVILHVARASPLAGSG